MCGFFICFILFFYLANSSISSDFFELSIAHINDFHASYEETNFEGGICMENQKCVGGFSRMFQTLMSLKAANPNIMLLNAGDNFQGSVWYSIFKWNVTQYFLNQIPFDAYTLGNHEFDDGVPGAAEFMKRLSAPITVSNVDSSKEKSLQGLYKKSTVVVRNGKKIGVVGVLLTEVREKSKVGKLQFVDEVESINEEAEKLIRDEEVFTIIVLSHCGYDMERAMAKKLGRKVSVIVGGHSHSLLWNGDSPPSRKAEGPYPTVELGKDRQKILIVQALSNALYVGNITIRYDHAGNVVDWYGKPIFQGSSLPRNDQVDREIDSWKKDLNTKINRVVGYTLTDITSTHCKRRECGIGNLLTDAMVFSKLTNETTLSWNEAPIAVVNAGSLKNAIHKGNITYQQLLSAVPFNDVIVVGRMKGKFLIKALEHSLTFFAEWRSRLLQVSGIQVTYDMTKQDNDRLISAKVRCSECKIPTYEDIQMEKEYSVIVHDFLVLGGDGFTMFRDNFTIIKRGDMDIQVLETYVLEKSPIWVEVGDRIKIIGDENITSRYRRK